MKQAILLLLITFFNSTTAFAINVERTILTASHPKKGYKVIVEFKDASISGFAKLTELIPDGMIATEIESQGGKFYFGDHKMKIIWMNVPISKTFRISYNLISQNNMIDQEVKGKFNYLVDNQITAVDILETAIPTFKKEVIPTETLVVSSSANEPKVESKSLSVESKISTDQIQYYVQIGAMGTDHHQFNNGVSNLADIQVKQYGNIYKYLSGSFTDINEAKVHRKKLLDLGISGAFIVKYKNGKRF